MLEFLSSESAFVQAQVYNVGVASAGPLPSGSSDVVRDSVRA